MAVLQTESAGSEDASGAAEMKGVNYTRGQRNAVEHLAGDRDNDMNRTTDKACTMTEAQRMAWYMLEGVE